MTDSNIMKILLKRSIEILKKEGFKGYITAIQNYYESYPPLRKNLYYWLYSKIKQSKLIVKEIQGSKMYLNLTDFGLSKYLFLNGIREPECTKIMKQELHKGMTIAEIGILAVPGVLIGAQIGVGVAKKVDRKKALRVLPVLFFVIGVLTVIKAFL